MQVSIVRERELSSILKGYLLTYGVGQMETPLNRLQKWLLYPPEIPVSINIEDNGPRYLVCKLLELRNISYFDGAEITGQANPILKLPRLCDRIEDLGLIVSNTIQSHAKNNMVKINGLHNFDILVISFLCMVGLNRWKIPRPLLDYDKLIKFVQIALDENLLNTNIDLSEYEEFDFHKFRKSRINYCKIFQGLKALLYGKFCTVRSSDLYRLQPFRYNKTLEEDRAWGLDGSANIPLYICASIEFCEFLRRKDLYRTCSKFISFDDIAHGFHKCLSFITIRMNSRLKNIKYSKVENQKLTLIKFGKFFGLSIPKRDFKFSPDFCSVSIDGLRFQLSNKQAHVVQILYENWKNNTPELFQALIINEVYGSTTKERKLKKLFHNDEVWKALIRKGARRGSIALNI